MLRTGQILVVELKNRKVAVHQPRLAGWWPEAHTIRKVAADQPRLAGWATDHSPATVCRFDPRKKVRFNLLTLAGEWSLFKPATYGRCSQVYWCSLGPMRAMSLGAQLIEIAVSNFSSDLEKCKELDDKSLVQSGEHQWTLQQITLWTACQVWDGKI